MLTSVAVWFRCRTLPFTVSKVKGETVSQPDIVIDMIAYADKDTVKYE